MKKLPVLDKYIVELCEGKNLDFTAVALELGNKTGLQHMAIPPKEIARRYWELVGGDKRPFIAKGVPTTLCETEEDSDENFVTIPDRFKIIPDFGAENRSKTNDPYSRRREGKQEALLVDTSDEESPVKTAGKSLDWR